MSAGKGKEPVPGVATIIPQQQKKSGDDNFVGRNGRSMKEMLDTAKNLMKAADSMHAEISKLQCKFAESLLRTTSIFDPSTTTLIEDGPSKTGRILSPEPIPDETCCGSAIETINDAFIDMASQCSQRPGPGTSMDF